MRICWKGYFDPAAELGVIAAAKPREGAWGGGQSPADAVLMPEVELPAGCEQAYLAGGLNSMAPHREP